MQVSWHPAFINQVSDQSQELDYTRHSGGCKPGMCVWYLPDSQNWWIVI